jgi:hypothetical protein
MDILNDTSLIDIDRHKLWQYNNAEKLNKLMDAKKQWLENYYTGFWQKMADELNVETATEYGLALLANLLDIHKTIKFYDGTLYEVSNDTFRLLLKMEAARFIADGTPNNTNMILDNLFRQYGKATVVDTHDMNYIPIVLSFMPDSEIQLVLENYDIAPRPSGVGVNFKYGLFEGWITYGDRRQMYTMSGGKMYFTQNLDTGV